MSRLRKILFAENKLPVYCSILILFTVLSFFFPLFNVFGYEFSVFIDVVISLITGAYILSALKKININEKIGKEKLFRQIKISAFYFLIIPAVLGIIHSLFTFNCSLSDGILFYIVITVPGYLTGLSLAVFSYMLSKKFGLLIFLLLFAGILLIALLEFYFYPQVYFYNAVFGYYPGTIYDEALSVSWKLAGYRLINVIFFASLFLTSIRALTSQSRKIKTATAAVFVIIPIVFYFVVSPSMGYTTTFSRLDSELGGTAVTQHFEIHYPASLDLKLVKVIAAEHEYYYYNLKKFFGYGIDEKINSYVFENRHQKAELFGSANADVAKIWQLSVYTTYNDYNTILKHELAHCFSSKIGTGLFKAASGLNPALIEGIAVAADPVYDNHTIDYMARLAYGSGYKVYIPKLFSGFNFFGQTSTLSYIYAGAFSRYMIKKYGIHKFAGFYEGKDFKKVYDFGITKAADEYYSYLDSDKVSNRVDQANHYFGRGTIFTKVCPRFVSDRVNKGWNLLNSGKYISAGKLFKEVLDKTDNYPALTGYSECLLKDGKKKQAAELLRKRLSSFKETAYYYSLELRLGDILAQIDDSDGADSLYTALAKQNPSRTLYNLASLRLDLSVTDSLLADYAGGSNFDKYMILKKLNKESYNYFSIPAVVNLSGAMNENYESFMKQFLRPLKVSGLPSAYALLKLSMYMAENSDLCGAAKIAEIAESFKADKDMHEIAEENSIKLNWLCSNFREVLEKTKINPN